MKPLRDFVVAQALVVFLVALGSIAISCHPQSVTVTAGVGSDGGTSWTASVSLIIQMAQAADPAVQQVADQSTALNAAQKAEFDHASQLAESSLALLQTALTNYVAVSGAPQVCQVRTAIDQVIGDRLQVIALLEQFGLSVPPEIAVIVGALGEFADGLLPPCPSAALAARVSETARIRAALSHAAH